MNSASALQEILAALGFYKGKIDGIAGPMTAAAFTAWKAANGTHTEPPVVAHPPTGLQHNDWPLESDAAVFFGYPPNLTQIESPFAWDTDDGKGIVTHMTCNIKVAASLRRIFAAIKAHYGGDIEAMRHDGVNYFDGIYSDRSKKGSAGRSMHAYGAAIDIDAAHNGQGTGHGRMPLAVVSIFKTEGWRWGGNYEGLSDPMHFEACK